MYWFSADPRCDGETGDITYTCSISDPRCDGETGSPLPKVYQSEMDTELVLAFLLY